jgi:hypothetical protein
LGAPHFDSYVADLITTRTVRRRFFGDRSRAD